MKMRKGAFLGMLAALMLYGLPGCEKEFLIEGNVVKTGFNFHDGFNTERLGEVHNKLRNGKFAVLPFKSAAEGKNYTIRIATDGDAVADMLTIQMLFHGYNVLERDQINKVLQEQAFRQSDLAAPPDSPTTGAGAKKTGALPYYYSSEQLTEIGKMLGVDYIIFGSVIQYQYEVTNAGHWYLSLGLSGRIIEVRTANITMAVSMEARGDNLSKALDGITIAFTDLLKEENAYVWQK
jgi:hypothetical protein